MTTMTSSRNPSFTVSLCAAFGMLLCLSSPALAGGDDDNPFAKPRTDVGFGMLVGGYTVGWVSGTGVGIHADAGRRHGSLFLMGEYDLLSIGESATQVEDPVRGTLHRVGLNARYSVVEFGGNEVPVQGQFWIEGGVGRQMVHWDEGGKLRRDDVGLGVGLQANVRIGKDKPKFFGFHYAFRAIIARSPDADGDQPFTCAGPCDEPSAPSPHDLGLFFNMGMTWGK